MTYSMSTITKLEDDVFKSGVRKEVGTSWMLMSSTGDEMQSKSYGDLQVSRLHVEPLLESIEKDILAAMALRDSYYDLQISRFNLDQDKARYIGRIEELGALERSAQNELQMISREKESALARRNGDAHYLEKVRDTGNQVYDDNARNTIVNLTQELSLLNFEGAHAPSDGDVRWRADKVRRLAGEIRNLEEIREKFQFWASLSSVEFRINSIDKEIEAIAHKEDSLKNKIESIGSEMIVTRGILESVVKSSGAGKALDYSGRIEEVRRHYEAIYLIVIAKAKAIKDGLFYLFSIDVSADWLIDINGRVEVGDVVFNNEYRNKSPIVEIDKIHSWWSVCRSYMERRKFSEMNADWLYISDDIEFANGPAEVQIDVARDSDGITRWLRGVSVTFFDAEDVNVFRGRFSGLGDNDFGGNVVIGAIRGEAASYQKSIYGVQTLLNRKMDGKWKLVIEKPLNATISERKFKFLVEFKAVSYKAT